MELKKNRPDKVSTAVNMLWIMIALGIIHLVLYYLNLIQIESLNEISSSVVLFTNIFSLAFLAFLIHKIGEGRNWARITFLVLFIIGIPLAVPSLFQSLMVNPISGFLSVGGTILQIIALIFLFQKPSSDWFKSKKKKK